MHAGIDSDWEGRFDAGGAWIAGRLLNVDQRFAAVLLQAQLSGAQPEEK